MPGNNNKNNNNNKTQLGQSLVLFTTITVHKSVLADSGTGSRVYHSTSIVYVPSLDETSRRDRGGYGADVNLSIAGVQDDIGNGGMS